jgi:hypothetical protein
MALSDRDIIITPNRGASSEPIITLRGADAASSASMVMRVINSGTVSTLSFEGTSGQLFAVSDTLSGSIFSVNDVSGIPSIEVLDTGDIKLAEWNGKVRVGGANNNENATSATTGELQVIGGVGVSRDVYVAGGMTVVGTLNAAVIAGSISNSANVAVTNDTSSGAAQYLTFVSGTSGNLPIKVDGSELVFVPSTGRIGIGNAAPAYKLDVTGEAQVQNYLRITNTGGAQALLMGNQDSAGVNNPSIIVAANGTTFFGNGNSWSGAGGTYTYRANISSSGLFLGVGTTAATYPLTIVNASPIMSIGNASNQGGAIYFGNSAHGVQRIGTGNDVSLYTTSGNVYLSANGVATTSHVALLNNGNVGIGIAAPGTKLHIRNSTPTGVTGVPTGTDLLIDSNTNSYLTFRQTNDIGLYGGIQWADNNVGAYIVFRNFTGSGTAAGSDSLIYGAYQDHIFQAGTSETVNGKIEVARITQAGNMGIGKTVPTTRLHVYRDGLSNNTVTPLITLDGKFNVTTVDNNDILAIASRIENNAGGSQTTNIIGSGYQATYNTLLLQPGGGNVGVNNINPGRTLDVTGVTNVSSHITQGALISRPNVAWGASGSATGAVVIKFPGGTGNYGMIHAVIDIYTYDGENASTIIIGGHNWNSAWYNFGATRIGAFSKGVRVGFKDGQYCIVLGTNTSTWSYGQVVVRKIQNGSYYSGIMDLGGTYSIALDAAAESYTYISGNLITTGTAGGGGWNSGNDGSGSGLDADLLDGLDSTAFLRRDVTNTMFAGQTSQLRFENLTTFFRFAFNDLRFYDLNNGADIFGLDEHAYATTSMRAPIFYDRNDTAYYVDPASTSLLNTLQLNGNITRLGGYSPTNGAIRMTPNLHLNALASYSVIVNWDNGTTGATQTFRIGNGASADVYYIRADGYSYQTNYAENASSFRAPIFYDSNNTAYYTDPASTSRLNDTHINSATVGTRTNTGTFGGNMTGVTGATQLLEVRTSGSIPLMTWHYESVATRHIGLDSSGFLQVYNPGEAGGSVLQANTSLRAPIFYDSNNTSFYIDPASSSIVNNLTVSGTLTYSGSLSVEGAEVLTTDLNTTSGNQGWDLHGNRAMQAIYGNHNPLNNGNVYNAALFRGGSWTMYGFNGSSWVNLGAVPNLTNGYGKANWGSVTLSRSYSQFIIDCGSTFGYTFMSALTLTHSTSGNSMDVYFEKSTSATYNSGTWTTMASATGVGSWPGGTSIKFSDVVGASYPPYVRLRIIPSWNAAYPSNTISLGQLFVSAAYGGGNQLLEWDTNYNVTANGSFRSPIFYDSSDTTYFMDPATNSRFGGQLVISGNTSGSAGNRLIVGSTTVNYSLQDTNLRSVIHAHGAYPVLSLNHTVTSNTNHGPTVQFTCNGVGNQFVIGTNGSGTQLDMGYSSSSDWNPHNGIAGYSGTTFFRATSSGLIGLGAQGDWGALGGGDPGYAIDTRGTLYNNTDVRAPIFYDANNTAFYADPAGTSVFNVINATTINATISGSANSVAYRGRISAETGRSVYSSGVYTFGTYTAANPGGNPPLTYPEIIAWGNGTGGSIQIAGDWISTTSTPLRVRSLRDCCQDWSSWSSIATSNESFTNNVDLRAPVFYDSNNTAFYVDPNGTSNVSGDFRVNQSGSSGIRLLSTTGTQSLWIRTGWDLAPTPSVSFNNVQFQSSGSSGGSFTFYSGNTLALTVTGDYAQGAASLRAPIFYDSNNTAFYADPASTSVFNNLTVSGTLTANVSPSSGFTLPCNVATGRSAYGRANANLVLLADSTYGAACIDFRSGVNYPSDGAQIYYETATNGVSGETSRLVIRTENDADDSILLRGGYIQYQSITVDGGSSNPGHRFTYNSTDRMYIYSDNTTETGSFRAPIFYDSNNTGFYTDPASTSRMNLVTVSNVGVTTGGAGSGIDLQAAGSGYLFGTTGDGANSTIANVKLTSWFGIGFAPSITGQAVPQWQNAAWIDVRSGAFSSRNEVTAYSSDQRLKTNFKNIENPIEKIKQIGGYEFDWDYDKCIGLGFKPSNIHEHGVKAQEIQKVVPDAVKVAPFDDDGEGNSKSGEDYLTVKYDRLVPLLIEAIKEQQSTIDQLRAEMQELKEFVKQSLGK